MVSGVNNSPIQTTKSEASSSTSKLQNTQAAQSLKATTASSHQSGNAAAGGSLKSTQDSSAAQAAGTIRKLSISDDIRQQFLSFDKEIVSQLRPNEGKIDKDARREIGQNTLKLINLVRENPRAFAALLTERFEAKDVEFQERNQTSFDRSIEILEKAASKKGKPRPFIENKKLHKALKDHTNDYAKNSTTGGHDSFDEHADATSTGNYAENAHRGDLNIFTAVEEWALDFGGQDYRAKDGILPSEQYKVADDGRIYDLKGHRQDKNDIEKGHLENLLFSTPKSAAVNVSSHTNPDTGKTTVSFLLGIEKY